MIYTRYGFSDSVFSMLVAQLASFCYVASIRSLLNVAVQLFLSKHYVFSDFRHVPHEQENILASYNAMKMCSKLELLPKPAGMTGFYRFIFTVTESVQLSSTKLTLTRRIKRRERLQTFALSRNFCRQAHLDTYREWIVVTLRTNRESSVSNGDNEEQTSLVNSIVLKQHRTRFSFSFSFPPVILPSPAGPCVNHYKITRSRTCTEHSAVKYFSSNAWVCTCKLNKAGRKAVVTKVTGSGTLYLK